MSRTALWVRLRSIGTCLRLSDQKNPRVRKICVRNSGGGFFANFMDAWKKCVRSAGNTMSIKFLVLGGVFWVFGGGGECRF